jgi:hypothetical protein
MAFELEGWCPQPGRPVGRNGKLMRPDRARRRRSSGADFLIRIPCIVAHLVRACVCIQLHSSPRSAPPFLSTTAVFSSTASDDTDRGSRTWIQRRPSEHARSSNRASATTLPESGRSPSAVPFSTSASASAPRAVLSPVVPSAAVVVSDRTRSSPAPGGGRRRKIKPMPITGYDAGAIEEYYNGRPLQVGWRLNSLGFPLLGTYILRVSTD